MDKLNIGFIGGCINKQDGIGKEKTYYFILKKLLSSNHSIDIDISSGKYLSYNQLVEKSASFISKKKPDILCVFIRPFPLMPLHKLLVKYEKKNGKTGASIHPHLFTRQMYWPSKLTVNQTDGPFVYKPKALFSLRDLNLLMGMSLFLHSWAMKYLANIFLEINAACTQANMKLIVVSPPKSPGSVLGNRVCSRTTTYFEQLCTNNSISYVNINILPESCFEKDKIHINEEGHSHLGRLFYDKVSQILIPA